jgi:hypothetical protein
MAGGESSVRVVNQWTDSSCATGESFKQTEDGRVWKTASGTSAPATGVTYGTMREGRIYPSNR